MEKLETDIEHAQYLQNLLINQATNGVADNSEYQQLRQYFLDNPALKSIIPSWVRVNRDLSQFWQFIKLKFSTYAERRTFVWSEFEPLLEMLEIGGKTPSDQAISDVMKTANSEANRTFPPIGTKNYCHYCKNFSLQCTA